MLVFLALIFASGENLSFFLTSFVMDDCEPIVGCVYNVCNDFLMMVALLMKLLTTLTMLVLRLTDESMLTRSTMATSMTRSIQQFFQVLTTTYHLEFRFGYFASVAWSCDYVWIADEFA